MYGTLDTVTACARVSFAHHSLCCDIYRVTRSCRGPLVHRLEMGICALRGSLGFCSQRTDSRHEGRKARRRGLLLSDDPSMPKHYSICSPSCIIYAYYTLDFINMEGKEMPLPQTGTLASSGTLSRPVSIGDTWNCHGMYGNTAWGQMFQVTTDVQHPPRTHTGYPHTGPTYDARRDCTFSFDIPAQPLSGKQINLR